MKTLKEFLNESEADLIRRAEKNALIFFKKHEVKIKKLVTTDAAKAKMRGQQTALRNAPPRTPMHSSSIGMNYDNRGMIHFNWPSGKGAKLSDIVKVIEKAVKSMKARIQWNKKASGMSNNVLEFWIL